MSTNISTNPLQLYNTLNRKKENFTPNQVGKVGLYVCGMTVYDYCHIGHARTVVAFDVLVRWLRATGYEVNYVRNITDIDDKIIKRANENGEEFTALTDRFITAMQEDFAKLGCVAPNKEPRATDFIDEMQNMVTSLIDKDHAYPADNGDVYFAVDKFADYGKLSGRKLEDMVAGASERTDVQTDKKHPFDFVLWKSAKPGEPSWQSPWGQGRPGWHIECSAMSTCCLGNNFDIHGGGHDLQFPHHENEIAQSEACTGEDYVNTWMHVGFVNVDGEKMSKSLNNFFTIRDVLKKYPAETVRYFIMGSHYRSSINFSDVALDEAHASLSRLYHALKAVEQLQQSVTVADALGNDAYSVRFINAMNDDLNTSEAFAVLFELARETNKYARMASEITAEMIAEDAEKATEKETAISQAVALATTLKTLAHSFNVLQQSPAEFLQATVGEGSADELSAEAIEALIEARKQAKADKNYSRADEIRQELLDQGVVLEDSRAGTTWRREA